MSNCCLRPRKRAWKVFVDNGEQLDPDDLTPHTTVHADNLDLAVFDAIHDLHDNYDDSDLEKLIVLEDNGQWWYIDVKVVPRIESRVQTTLDELCGDGG